MCSIGEAARLADQLTRGTHICQVVDALHQLYFYELSLETYTQLEIDKKANRWLNDPTSEVANIATNLVEKIDQMKQEDHRNRRRMMSDPQFKRPLDPMEVSRTPRDDGQHHPYSSNQRSSKVIKKEIVDNHHYHHVPNSPFAPRIRNRDCYDIKPDVSKLQCTPGCQTPIPSNTGKFCQKSIKVEVKEEPIDYDYPDCQPVEAPKKPEFDVMSLKDVAHFEYDEIIPELVKLPVDDLKTFMNRNPEIAEIGDFLFRRRCQEVIPDRLPEIRHFRRWRHLHDYYTTVNFKFTC